MKALSTLVVFVACAIVVAPLQGAKQAPLLQTTPAAPVLRPGLADRFVGTWLGDVISDVHGSSRSNVQIVITKIGPNQVRVESDYKRIPAVTFRLTRLATKIYNDDNSAGVFFYDMEKSPPQLDVNFNGDIAWSGHREGQR